MTPWCLAPEIGYPWLCIAATIAGSTPAETTASSLASWLAVSAMLARVVHPSFWISDWSWLLRAQQRYFSYRAILVAIVSQSTFVLVFRGIAQLSRDMSQNGVSHRCAFVKLSSKGGYRTILGEC